MVKTLSPPVLGTNGLFGTSVAINNDTLIIGESGANLAHVYQRNQGGSDNWGLVKTLLPPVLSTPSDVFGDSVTIDGDTVVVGDPFQENLAGDQIGSAHIYYRNQGGIDNWGYIKTLLSPNPFDRSSFAVNGSLAINGDTIVIGEENGSGTTIGGYVYIFYRDNGGVNNWGLVKTLNINTPNAQFGRSVAIDSDTLIVGSPNNSMNVGTVYIYYRNTGGTDNWGNVISFNSPNPESGAKFGVSVAIDGDNIIVGESRKDISSCINVGNTHTYSRNTGGIDMWGIISTFASGINIGQPEFSDSVDISGNNIIVGAPDQDLDGLVNSGATYIIDTSSPVSGTWYLLQRIVASDAQTDDTFGSTISISGDGLTIISGLPF